MSATVNSMIEQLDDSIAEISHDIDRLSEMRDRFKAARLALAPQAPAGHRKIEPAPIVKPAAPQRKPKVMRKHDWPAIAQVIKTADAAGIARIQALRKAYPNVDSYWLVKRCRELSLIDLPTPRPAPAVDPDTVTACSQQRWLAARHGRRRPRRRTVGCGR